METNTYNVPQQQWNEFGTNGQKFFNQLYQRCQSQKTQILKDIPKNDMRQEIEKVLDKTILYDVQQATQLFVQQQLQPHDE